MNQYDHEYEPFCQRFVTTQLRDFWVSLNNLMPSRSVGFFLIRLLINQLGLQKRAKVARVLLTQSQSLEGGGSEGNGVLALVILAVSNIVANQCWDK